MLQPLTSPLAHTRAQTKRTDTLARRECFQFAVVLSVDFILLKSHALNTRILYPLYVNQQHGVTSHLSSPVRLSPLYISRGAAKGMNWISIIKETSVSQNVPRECQQWLEEWMTVINNLTQLERDMYVLFKINNSSKDILCYNARYKFSNFIADNIGRRSNTCSSTCVVTHAHANKFILNIKIIKNWTRRRGTVLNFKPLF